MSLVPWDRFRVLRRRGDLFDELFRESFRRPIFEEGEVLEPAVDTVSADRLTVYGEARPGRSSTSGCAARWLLALFVVLGSTSVMRAARADETPAASDIESGGPDTGQTPDADGWGTGPYLVLPSLQPLTVRDGIGYGVDGLLDPVGYVTPFLATTGMSVVKQVNKRSLNLELFQDVEDSALDLYSAVRNGYLQRRHGSIEEAIEARHTEWHPPPVKETAER